MFTEVEVERIKTRHPTHQGRNEEEAQVEEQPKEQVAATKNAEANDHTPEVIHTLKPSQLELRSKILIELKNNNERIRLPPLKKTKRNDLIRILRDINTVIDTIHTESLTETNKLMYSTAVVATRELGYDISPERKQQKQPKWKIRLKWKLGQLRADLSCIKKWKDGKLNDQRKKDYLWHKYKMAEKRIPTVMEELKQRIMATANKIERYERRIVQYRQNQLFKTDQKRFYKSLENSNTGKQNLPDKEATYGFWRDIWDNSTKHNGEAKWIKDTKKQMKTPKMPEFQITTELVKKQARKSKNWSTPGPDEIHGYWLKHLTKLHERLAGQFNTVLDDPTDYQWLTLGKTFLIMKDPQKGAIPSNYRPITCLPTTFKVLTGILGGNICTPNNKQPIPSGTKRKL
ncbi:uncharacterized protein LOC115890869 [Sitophilus oryzae]|uniref:Uncharacterized protein LOC115890869 n=1 Tax=Sitophilus oryzae TaxID=7048 RepID=A0A6J2YSK3_SITOR|nr:uncharacterized protein LOC115890869 [Sitophilus oryzae]